MSYHRAARDVGPERLLYWYLFRRKEHISLAAMAELLLALQTPVRDKPEGRWTYPTKSDGSLDWNKGVYHELPGKKENKHRNEQMAALRKTLEQMLKHPMPKEV